MNLRRSFWTGICTALCLNGMVVLADETPVKVPLAEPQDVLLNVTNVQVEEDVEVVAQDPTVRKTQVIVTEGAGGGGLAVATEEGVAGTIAIEPDQSKYWVGLLCNTASDALKTQ